MFKIRSLFLFFVLTIFIVTNFSEYAFARAGGRSSFGGGRGSSSFYNQGSRGSRTYDGGSYGNKNYAPVNKSTTAPKVDNNGYNNSRSTPTSPNAASSFFQRNPFMAGIGGALVGSWIGHMIFGNSMGGMGIGGGAGSSLINFLLIALAAGGIWFWIRSANRKSVAGMPNNFDQQNYENVNNFNGPFSSAVQGQVVNQDNNIELPKSEQNKFAQILIDVQNAWSMQNLEALKKLVSVEMYKYFTDTLNQNLSQSLANKVENIKVLNVDLSEAWREDESEYATIMLEWSALDYTCNINVNSDSANYIVEGDNQNPTESSEAWTFVRYGINGKWILSAIQQVS
jgi:predicted lipid-binding transport protein (Tim44 family)